MVHKESDNYSVGMNAVVAAGLPPRKVQEMRSKQETVAECQIEDSMEEYQEEKNNFHQMVKLNLQYLKFEETYGKELTHIVEGLLQYDVNERISLNEVIDILRDDAET